MRVIIDDEKHERWRERSLRYLERHHEEVHERRVIYARQNRETLNQQARDYRRKHPDRIKEAYDKWASTHRVQLATLRRRWRLANIDRVRNNHNAWMTAHPDKRRIAEHRWRARKHSQSIGTIDLGYIALRDRMRCGVCGGKVSKKELSFDHIIPLSKGGVNAEWNLQVAHRLCNSRKRDCLVSHQMRLPLIPPKGK